MSVPLPKLITLYKRSSKPLTAVVWIVVVILSGIVGNSSANRYDANQAKVWIATPCVNLKVEANTVMFTRQPYRSR